MATSTLQCPFSSDNLADFKAWAQFISNAFSTFGWTQTTDTGQVNWGTIGAVPAVGTTVYEIWKAADTLASTCPIFIRMDYGQGATANNVLLKVQFGTGSNGSGTLTGNTTAQTNLVLNGTSAPAVVDCYASGDSGGRIAFLMWRPNTTFATFFAVERSLDSTGAYTGSYYTAITLSNGSATYTHIWPVGSGTTFVVASVRASFPAVCTGSLSGAAIGSLAPVVPLCPIVGKVDNPMTVLAGMLGNDNAGEGVSFTCTLYGATRTYMFTKAAVSFMNFGPNTNLFCCMRYD